MTTVNSHVATRVQCHIPSPTKANIHLKNTESASVTTAATRCFQKSGYSTVEPIGIPHLCFREGERDVYARVKAVFSYSRAASKHSERSKKDQICAKRSVRRGWCCCRSPLSQWAHWVDFIGFSPKLTLCCHSWGESIYWNSGIVDPTREPPLLVNREPRPESCRMIKYITISNKRNFIDRPSKSPNKSSRSSSGAQLPVVKIEGGKSRLSTKPIIRSSLSWSIVISSNRVAETQTRQMKG